MTSYAQEQVTPYDHQREKSEQVEEMFDHIAHSYDQLNTTLSVGIDKLWRRKAIKTLQAYRPQRLLDVATGTGDFAILACRKLKPQQIIGIDISEGMMAVGRKKVEQAGLETVIRFKREDCTALSFDAESRQPHLIGATCVGCHLCRLVCPTGAIGSAKRVGKKK